MVTYEQIYKKFKTDTGIDASQIEDYRPCMEPYSDHFISGAIIIWLKNGSRIIYIPK